MLNKIRNYIIQRSIKHYSKKNQYPLCLSPFSLSYYHNIINNISQHLQINCLNFEDKINYNKTNFIFRHDLDTQKCLENFRLLADIHLELNIPLSVFVRMDSLDYPAEASFECVKPYLGQLQIGLHSSCYIDEKPLKKLEKEINIFNGIYKFYPKLMTLHGLGNYKYSERLQLIQDLSNSYKNFGFTFTDCVPDLRIYNYVIQDCHLDSNNHRYLKKDFITLPPAIKGNCYLVLAHPCYWKK